MLPRTEVPRGGPRHAVILVGRYQVGDRPPEEVLITDLGADGCRLRASSVGVTKMDPIQLWLADVGPIPARLKWIKKGSLGLAFESPLDDAILHTLLEAAPPTADTNVVPLRRRAAH